MALNQMLLGLLTEPYKEDVHRLGQISFIFRYF